MRLLLLLPLAVLAGCGGTQTNTTDAAVEGSGGAIVNLAPPPEAAVPENAASAAAAATPDWTGRWIGVEGTYLVISPGSAPDSYRLEMQYTLDDKGVFEGSAAGDGIAFVRPDGSQTLRHTDGDATGLKYLAGKKDCLTVKPGEGYCRD